ncbi:MAG: hypothetical protein ACREQ2_03980 [Candidatus Binatia bacterium]
MTKRFEDIARRKQALIDKAARERAELAAAYSKLRSPFDFSGTISAIGRALKARPMITVGVSSLLVSGLAGKIFRGASQVLKVGRVALPLWAWWRKRRKSS